MRVKDLEAGKEYATCNGVLVVPVEPVHGRYVVVYDQKAEAWIVAERDGDGDPWANCGPKAGRNNVRVKGVKVEVYLFDRDGVRIGKPTRTTVVPPRDIKGTWADYRALHPERVQDVADTREKEVERDELRKVVNEAFTEFARRHNLPGANTSVYSQADGNWSIQLHLRTKELTGTQVRNLAKRLAHDGRRKAAA